MQAKLPDINSAIVRHRSGALVALSQDNYHMASTELSAINALLPGEYKVKIDNETYYEKIKGQDILTCNNCNEESEYAELTFYRKPIQSELRLLFHIEFIEIWKCDKCHFENPKEGTKRTIRKFTPPFYTGYMPNPPKMDSFGNRASYRIAFAKWFDIAINELESQVGIYRGDYSAQEDDAGNIEDEED